jgi:hypothetical protein
MMETQSFQHLVTELEALTEARREAILARLQYLLSHATRQRLCKERQSEHADCPHCHSYHIVRFGFTHQQQSIAAGGAWTLPTLVSEVQQATK